MKITAFDRRKLSDDEEENAGTRKTHVYTGMYAKIKQFPGRTVAVNTAYRRWQRNPKMSLEEICTAPIDKGKHRFAHRHDPDYLADLASNMKLKDIAAKWGLNYNTASNHRKKEKGKQ